MITIYDINNNLYIFSAVVLLVHFYIHVIFVFLYWNIGHVMCINATKYIICFNI